MQCKWMVYMNKKFLIFLLLLCIGLFLVIFFLVDVCDIIIYYMNDLYVYVILEIIFYVFKICLVGGFVFILKIVKDVKVKEKDVFFFDVGDYFIGFFISMLIKGEVIIDILNIMFYDVVFVGNYEFDYGYENLVKQFSKL